MGSPVRVWERGTMCGSVLGGLLLLGLLGVPAPAAAQASSGLAARLDSAARAHVASPIIPGVSVSVVRRGEVLLERGYGLVDLEWAVPTPLDASASYEIGSVTKQFTSVAMLLLAEDGKVDLDAELSDYLDFDAGGRAIPLRRMFDHTSGIRSYTEMEAFGEYSVHKLPRDTLVQAIEDTPFDFEPGGGLIYNNSAYFLLGLIIEKVSGQSYEDFVRERLFEPAGMADSYYCSEALVRPGRAHGYDAVRPDMVIRARYLDHTWPYAAGSLCSTVGDLVKWNSALHGGELLSAESYAALTTPRPLSDGSPVRYAMGLTATDNGGRRLIAHGGGINGFLSDGRYYPDEELIVVVLQNSTGPVGPGALGGALADIVLGPVADAAAMTFAGNPSELAGTYSGPARGQDMTLVASVVDGALQLEVNGEDPITPAFRGELSWGFGNNRVWFVRRGGEVVEAHFDAPSAHYILRPVG